MSEDLGLETEVADGLAVEAGLLTGSGRGEFDVVDAEVVQGLGDANLGLGVEEGVGELLALAEGGLDDLKLATERDLRVSKSFPAIMLGSSLGLLRDVA